jgi:hypothetical protein
MIGNPEKIEDFGKWLCDSSFSAVVIIAGNHDILFQKKPEKARKLLSKHDKIYYLRTADAGSKMSHFMVRHGSLSSVLDGHLPSKRKSS